jgi:hypothetical protein
VGEPASAGAGAWRHGAVTAASAKGG